MEPTRRPSVPAVRRIGDEELTASYERVSLARSGSTPALGGLALIPESAAVGGTPDLTDVREAVLRHQQAFTYLDRAGQNQKRALYELANAEHVCEAAETAAAAAQAQRRRPSQVQVQLDIVLAATGRRPSQPQAATATDSASASAESVGTTPSVTPHQLTECVDKVTRHLRAAYPVQEQAADQIALAAKEGAEAFDVHRLPDLAERQREILHSTQILIWEQVGLRQDPFGRPETDARRPLPGTSTPVDELRALRTALESITAAQKELNRQVGEYHAALGRSAAEQALGLLPPPGSPPLDPAVARATAERVARVLAADTGRDSPALAVASAVASPTGSAPASVAVSPAGSVPTSVAGDDPATPSRSMSVGSVEMTRYMAALRSPGSPEGGPATPSPGTRSPVLRRPSWPRIVGRRQTG
ncbi:hypothetical protein [Micromonospora sp. SH-82]|uniref:hypothetical protein n=1 Tax=Micromonospora sp. SH-82 TaxID=3132938 RepID=UPI003EB7E95B